MRSILALLFLLAGLAAAKPNLVKDLKSYDPAALPRTTAGNGTLLKLPSFPRATDALLDQYALAFEKVLKHADTLPRSEP